MISRRKVYWNSCYLRAWNRCNEPTQDVYSDKTQKDIYLRLNIKKEIVEIFGNKLIFITVRPNTLYVVVTSEAIESTWNMSDKESSIKDMANYLREDIQEYCGSLTTTSQLVSNRWRAFHWKKTAAHPSNIIFNKSFKIKWWCWNYKSQ